MSVDPDSKENRRHRRPHFSHRQWSRTHPSYRALVPHRNFDHIDEDDETKDDYAARIAERFGFPKAVLDQWLYCHFYNEHSVPNYGWIDYDTVQFDLQTWPLASFLALRVITAFSESYVDHRAANFGCVDGFCCVPADKEHWRSYGTWRVPPIAIDTEGIGKVPKYSDVVGRFQLVEGHSRLGYLRAMHRVGEDAGCKLADQHLVYVLRRKASHSSEPPRGGSGSSSSTP